jgi:hypothetical protein
MELAPIPISSSSARGAYPSVRARRIASVKFMGLDVDGEMEAAPWGRPASRAGGGILSIVFRVIGRLVAARP